MSVQLSMPMFIGKPALNMASISQFLREKFPDINEVCDESSDEDIISFSLDGTKVFLAPMDVAIPWSELEGPCATSVLWNNAEVEVKAHDNHMIVTVMSDDLAPIEIAKVLTQVTAAVLATSTNCIGVYWGNATLIVPNKVFCDFATEVMLEGPPLFIWVDYRIGPDENETSTGFTAGMKALGLMEIEAIKTPETFVDLKDRLFSLSEYLLMNGLVIKDGDTVGVDENEKIKVVYSKSQFGHKEMVMQLQYGDGPSKPWYKFW